MKSRKIGKNSIILEEPLAAAPETFCCKNVTPVISNGRAFISGPRKGRLNGNVTSVSGRERSFIHNTKGAPLNSITERKVINNPIKIGN